MISETMDVLRSSHVDGEDGSITLTFGPAPVASDSRPSSGAHCPHCDHEIDMGRLIRESLTYMPYITSARKSPSVERSKSDFAVYTLGEQKRPKPKKPSLGEKRNSGIF